MLAVAEFDSLWNLHMLQQIVPVHPIVQRALTAIALNRTPGYHFCGNFFNLGYQEVDSAHSILTLEPGPQNLDADGQISIVAFGMLADMGLASNIRYGLTVNDRLATVSLTLQFIEAARRGRLTVSSYSQGFLQAALPAADGQVVRSSNPLTTLPRSYQHGSQGISQTRITSENQLLCVGHAAFMVLPVPGGKTLAPIPWVNTKPPIDPPLDLATLNEDETLILKRVEQAVAVCEREGGDFGTHFLGLYPQKQAHGAYVQIENGPHIGNRVKHVQGGIVLALGMETAAAALGAEWMLSGITATYISPGEGESISATATIVHRGRMTAVVRTQIVNSSGRTALDVLTTHARTA